ncbi:hypothetical protein ASD84_15350 [Nocardioides sp. Root682]|nr:hypothetical protein [Nocardioides sp. Root682]KRA87457.1 hypothetical protein ASD84_15350 [Nocardioides sp. Root682]
MGYLAIIGFPPFSGFWSKDKIIEVALIENPIVGICALLGAGITGFYMTRLMLMTYFTQKRWEKGVHPHESPKVMTIPLIVLAALSVLGGLMLASNWIVEWLSPVVGHAEHHEPPIPVILITLITVAVVAVGVGLAWFLVGKQDVPRVAPADVSFATKAARADLYGDAINDALVVTPGKATVTAMVGADRTLVDGAFTGGSTILTGTGELLRKLQTGYVRSYALSIFVGAVILVLTLVAVNS